MGKQLCGPELPTGVKSWHSCSSGLLDKKKKKMLCYKVFYFLDIIFGSFKVPVAIAVFLRGMDGFSSGVWKYWQDDEYEQLNFFFFFTYFFSGPLWSFLWKLNITELTEGLLLYATIGLDVSFLCSCHFYAMFRQVKYVYLNPFLGIHMKTAAVQIQRRHFGIVYSIFIKALSSKAALWI